MPYVIDVFVSPVRDNPVAHVAITLVFILIILDVIFGIINAVLSHTFSSEKMRQGIAHKSAEVGFVLVGVLADAALLGGFDELGFNAPALLAICAYICVMELGSLLETFAVMNPALADTPFFKILDSVHIKEG